MTLFRLGQSERREPGDVGLERRYAFNADLLGPPVERLEMSGRLDRIYNARALRTILDIVQSILLLS